MDYDLSSSTAETFVDIEITDSKLLRRLELSARSSKPISEDDSKELGYRGLRITRDGLVDYNHINISLGGQETSALRTLMERPEDLGMREDIGVDLSPKNNKPANMAKPISGLRGKLKEVVGYNCIENISGQGWVLKISSIE